MSIRLSVCLQAHENSGIHDKIRMRGKEKNAARERKRKDGRCKTKPHTSTATVNQGKHCRRRRQSLFLLPFSSFTQR